LADDGGELLVIRCFISWTRWTYQHHFGLHFPHLPYHLQPHFLLPQSVKKETCLVVNLSLNHPMRRMMIWKPWMRKSKTLRRQNHSWKEQRSEQSEKL
jgi:hypothetical protein